MIQDVPVWGRDRAFEPPTRTIRPQRHRNHPPMSCSLASYTSPQEHSISMVLVGGGHPEYRKAIHSFHAKAGRASRSRVTNPYS
jgi:hypothetical protein